MIDFIRPTFVVLAALAKWQVGFAVALMTPLFVVPEKVLADSFFLDDGTQIEGEIARSTPSAIFIGEKTGGLRLIQLSRVDAVQIGGQDQPLLKGRLLGWREGIYTIEIDGQVVDVGATTEPVRSETILPTQPPQAAPKLAGEQLAARPVTLDKTDSVDRPTRDTDVDIAVKQGAEGALDTTISASIEPRPESEPATLQLQLSHPLDDVLVIIFSTQSGSAEPDSDFEPQSGIAYIQPASTSSEVNITVFDDDLPETDEHFTVYISVDPRLATLDNSRVVATILDND